MTTLESPAPNALARVGGALTALRGIPLAGRLAWPGTVLAVAVIDLIAGALGLWWINLVVGVFVGATRLRRRIPALVLGTAFAWALGILLESGGRTWDVAGEVAAMVFNARSLGWLIYLLAIVYGLLLALAGAWAGGAGRRVAALRSATAPDAGDGTAGDLETHAGQADFEAEGEHV